jgi:hypothetical protein
MVEWVWLVAIVVLGLALFAFGTRQRKLSRAERERADQATRENWDKEEVR